MFIPCMCCGRELPDNWSWWVCDTCGYKKDASSLKETRRHPKYLGSSRNYLVANFIHLYCQTNHVFPCQSQSRFSV